MSLLGTLTVLPRVVPVVAGVLAVGGVAVAVLPARVRTRRALRRRWLACLPAAALFLGALSLGPLGAALLAVALGLVAVGAYVRTTGLGRGEHTALAAAAVVLPVVAWAGPRAFGLPLFGLLFLAAVAPALFSGDRARSGERAARAVFAMLWIPVALTGLVMLQGTAVAVGLAVAFGELGGRCGGLLLSRLGGTLARPLAAHSPARTWGGVIGAGMAVAAALGTAGAFTEGMWVVVLCGVVMGGLLGSAVTRGAGARDAGARLPLLGGVLDRMGSLLLTLLLTMAATL
ncbi:phosphatidate cytidylyltransferase [Streptomyces sp. NPDC053079]|uniref:phosphatidate cytidylyltransferase n=1 Tax=Streptomyces sp. NPDC053079 TaxID=3365697 RepID=UPI0037CF4BAB